MRRLVAAICGAALACLLAPQAHADTYGEMYAAVDWLARKYGVTAYTGQAPMEYGTYAATMGDTIIFNSGYINDPALLHRDMAIDQAAGRFHSARCTPEHAIAAHEFGHVLDNLTGHNTDYELDYALANGFTGQVSGYGLSSYDEAIAESFAAVECDSPTPAELAIYQMLTT